MPASDQDTSQFLIKGGNFGPEEELRHPTMLWFIQSFQTEHPHSKIKESWLLKISHREVTPPGKQFLRIRTPPASQSGPGKVKQESVYFLFRANNFTVKDKMICNRDWPENNEEEAGEERLGRSEQKAQGKKNERGGWNNSTLGSSCAAKLPEFVHGRGMRPGAGSFPAQLPEL